MTASNPFHLAIPVSDLDVTLAFYEEHLGCSRGRQSRDWVDLNFFGHQLVLHRTDVSKGAGAKGANPVDGEQVPVPHFGVVLEWEAFDGLVAQLSAAWAPLAARRQKKRRAETARSSRRTRQTSRVEVQVPVRSARRAGATPKRGHRGS